ncbi:putative ZIP family zinc transporter [Aspergillus glaucus CBS 516.65]|uniref:Zinc/iron permease n=1 Tax=Aspergillus glaucus CBS 516.65 TaxID=1160497 RepID=A0A1L9VYC2_ASPGL|nr:hypothetical protein ASPGLDRAFT_22363 [Aspergillus glaucus CBS 516.65]OJJ88911.1 hypothetical protein ASPGLDRAFT_22363 [Aspergillus glaucus CBS 516.65]
MDTGSLESDPGIPVVSRSFSSISDIPAAILRAELARRNEVRDEDAEKATCGSTRSGAYNTPAHVMALFLILVLSTLACSFPVLARRFPRLPIPRRFLFISRHFGTGVLIATAFVHLLPTAFVSLTDPCLPRFWSKSYRAMAGFVAMISVFVVVCVEMFFAMKGAGHVHASGYDNLINEVEHDDPSGLENDGSGYSRVNWQDGADDIHLGSMPAANRQQTAPGSASRISGDHRQRMKDMEPDKENEDAGLEELEPYADGDSMLNGSESHRPVLPVHRRQTDPGLPNPNAQRQLLQCLLLEAGILFHSIFIGMAVSVATGASFVVLLVAISFHQTFEGFALGSRIASLIPDLFSPTSMKPWLMCLAYGTTTPIGQAIGLFMHNLYDPASTAGLLMVGITNAISSGLLLFAGLVELLAEDFLSESSYETLRGKRRIEACIAVASGALLMALVGAFA